VNGVAIIEQQRPSEENISVERANGNGINNQTMGDFRAFGPSNGNK